MNELIIPSNRFSDRFNRYYVEDISNWPSAQYLWNSNYVIGRYISSLEYLYQNKLDPRVGILPRGFCGSRSEAIRLYDIAESIRTKGYIEQLTPYDGIVCYRSSSRLSLQQGNHRTAVLKYFGMRIPAVVMELRNANS